MPPFILPDAAGRLVSLSSLLQDDPLVISFNRGHWCEYCAIQLAALSQAMSEIAARGASVVSIMPETGTFAAKIGADIIHAFPILSDFDNGYALDVGSVVWLGDSVRRLYQRDGLDIEHYQGNDMWFVPIPATFVVGGDGKIIKRYIDPDFRTRME